MLRTGLVCHVKFAISVTVSFHLKHNECLFSGENLVKVILGCKCDQEDTREVTREEAQVLAIKHSARYFECSAKTGHNIVDMFESTAKSIMAIMDGWEPPVLRPVSGPLAMQAQLSRRSLRGATNWRKKLSVRRGARSLRKSFRLNLSTKGTKHVFINKGYKRQTRRDIGKTLLLDVLKNIKLKVLHLAKSMRSKIFVFLAI